MDKADIMRRPVHDRPLAAPGLISYRCQSPTLNGSWIMIGALDDVDAMRQARLSNSLAREADLQIWSDRGYVPAPVALGVRGIRRPAAVDPDLIDDSNAPPDFEIPSFVQALP